MISLSLFVAAVESEVDRPQPILLSASTSEEASKALRQYVACLDTRILTEPVRSDRRDAAILASEARASCEASKAAAVQVWIREYDKTPELKGSWSSESAALRVVSSFDADLEWKIHDAREQRSQPKTE